MHYRKNVRTFVQSRYFTIKFLVTFAQRTLHKVYSVIILCMPGRFAEILLRPVARCCSFIRGDMLF